MINLEKLKKEPSAETDNDEEAIQQIYDYAASLMFESSTSALETKNALMAQGIDEDASKIIVNNLIDYYRKQTAAGKNILYGPLWCVGGIVATVADIGYIFWGAVVFGGIQFLRGCYQYFKYQKQ